MNRNRPLIAAALAASLVCLLPACSSADDHGAAPRTISVTGSGEASGAPDQATVNAGVQTTAATAVESAQQNQAIVARIMDALDEAGIDEDDIRTTDYSIWPEQRHDPRGSGESRIVGYRVSNVVNVTVNDIDRIGEVLGAVTNAGANTINGIQFGIRDIGELEAAARAAAMRDARERAEALAELADVDLGEVISISMSHGGGYPVPIMRGRMEMAQAAAPDISPGQQTVSVQVAVTYAID